MKDKLHILIIGGSSFVAGSFMQEYGGNYVFIPVVRKSGSNVQGGKVVDDFFAIPDELFKGIDVIINCAAIVHQRKKQSANLYYRINAKLPVHLAEQAKRNGIKKFIQLSTIGVYGNKEDVNDFSTEAPMNTYAMSKTEADKNLIPLAGGQFEVIILRPPMVYGNANAPGNMMRLIKLVKTGLPLPFGNAIQKRSFIHIKNLAGYINAAIVEGKTGIYMPGDITPVSTRELITVIAEKLEVRVRLFSIPGFILTFLVKVKPEVFDKLFGKMIIDSTKTNNSLKYFPVFNLESGIGEMCKEL